MRRVDDSDETPGGDSFLDIVANIVGILVLLVVVVGVRAGRQVFVPEPVVTNAEPLEAIKQEINEAAQQARTEQAEAIAMRERVFAAAAEAERRAQEREAATFYVTKLRAEIDEASGHLGENDQRSLATHNAIAQTQLKLDRLTRQQIGLASFEAPPELETVTVAQTPIVKDRITDSISFRLKEGRMTYVPFDEIIAYARRHPDPPKWFAGNKRYRNERTIGPILGFHADIREIYQYKSRPGSAVRTSGENAVYSKNFHHAIYSIKLRDAGEDLGEPCEEALSMGSTVWLRLAGVDPESEVLEIAIYPDAFSDFAQLEGQLRKQGFRVAKRLKNRGTPMGVSVQGTQSLLQ